MKTTVKTGALCALMMLSLGWASPAKAGADFKDMMDDLRCSRMAISLIGRGDCPAEEKSILVAGSIAMLRYTRVLKAEFEKSSGDLTISYGGGNSISSLIAVSRHAIDIAAVARDLKPKEMTVDLRAVLIGRDGVAVVLNPANPLSNLSRKDAAALFTGGIKSWSAIPGGANLPVHVFTRQDDSATRQSLVELALDGNDVTHQATVAKEATDIVEAVAKDPAAIGYVALHDVDPAVKVSAIDGVPMSETTLLSGRYPYSRPLYYITKGEPSALEARFIEFATSPQGQAVIEKAGALRVR